MKIFITIIYLLGMYNTCMSQDLVYKPKNPAFGGDTFNYQWMLSSAESQNKFVEDDGLGSGSELTPLEQFKENLNNQLLDLVSSSLFEKQFGDKGISPGTYSFGSLGVKIYESNVGLVVDILDKDTGEKTQLIVPGG